MFDEPDNNAIGYLSSKVGCELGTYLHLSIANPSLTNGSNKSTYQLTSESEKEKGIGITERKKEKAERERRRGEEKRKKEKGKKRERDI